MRAMLNIAWRSAWHRRFSLSLVVLTLALTTFLLLGVERLRHDVKRNFMDAVSGTDLIVGARTGPVQLLLHTVFRIGEPTRNIGMDSVKALQADRAVAWVVPISLGDTHRGYPVVGTTTGYFQHFRWGDRQALTLRQGRVFEEVFEAVIGAEVAQQLGYGLGQPLVLRHGAGELQSNDHADMPFVVVGILARTGTPVDRSVHIDLRGMEALHLDWMAGVPIPGRRTTVDEALAHNLQPRAVTAALVGLKSRAAVFAVQRRVADYEGEPLMAVLPGVALDQLWGLLQWAERALLAMGILVGVVSLAGLVAVVVTALDQRRRELAILRSVGAGPRAVMGLLMLEGLLLGVCGAVLGLCAWAVLLTASAAWAQAQWGLVFSAGWPRASEWVQLAGVVACGTLASLIPAWRAYRLSLADGLAPRMG